ncbi:DNA-binding transcriptional regulator, LysR family [Eubacterium ruminantium]|uniref:DNA-binding transcriptional regulator, LysR family n=1 Tax=Eubacterium ruminantium TaxID=42322 RepID=A0A1T4QD54_9FIRM|nr:LysR family transcriptional regulator [Eubacterium ruminantium]SCW68847.1 DNA-binding transcriptional regulator, LysR family [Eubacterium ruminantium]SDN36860.1 transcriptional regulator, LysR family [Eubacterium ruminantium]SKA01625.1 DNA-binding transcriptional regulator, LysR family [Eubacterium ruminantium]
MNNTQLETFLKIAETRNFTLAANLLGYAQSTVTTQIKQLEEELGCLLFERLGKSLTVTAEGEKLSIYAEKMLQLEREILLEIPTTKEPSGIIKLGVSESLCYNRFPKILLEYKQKYPKVDIMLQFINHDTFPVMLKKGVLDLVYTLNPLIENPELNMIDKKEESLGFYVSPGHPLAKKRKVTEEDLEGVPLLLTSHTCSFRQMLLDDFAKHGITPTIELETSSKEILKQFAISQLGVAFMPDMVATDEIQNKKLKRLNWAGDTFPIYSQVFIHKDKHLSKAIEELITLIS